MPTMAAIGKAFRIQLCSAALKPRLGRYPKIRGNQAPQMKNSSTIIRISLSRIVLFIDVRGRSWGEALVRFSPHRGRLGQFEPFTIVASQELIGVDGLATGFHH